jgi:hypothetical protein
MVPTQFGSCAQLRMLKQQDMTSLSGALETLSVHAIRRSV